METNTAQTEISARDELIRIIRTSYKYEGKKLEVFDELIFSQPTDKEQIALLKDIFAFITLPFPDDVPEMIDSPDTPISAAREIRGQVEALNNSGEINCCRCFDGKTALEAATAVHADLKMLGDRLGKTARIIWLAVILGSRHIPCADVTNYDEKADPDFSLLAEYPETFAQLAVILEQGNYRAIASWLASVPCDNNELRAALISYTLSFLFRECEEKVMPTTGSFTFVM
ncbi:MAG: hypothetical protein WCX12_02125 [Candidatus Paceibacterota bacterium]